MKYPDHEFTHLLLGLVLLDLSPSWWIIAFVAAQILLIAAFFITGRHKV